MRRAMMLVGVLTCAWLTVLNAQTPAIQLGVAGGAAITTFTGDDADDAESRTSAFFGASFVFHNPATVVGFETGLLYVSKGATSSFEGDKMALEITYIEVPLLLRLGFRLQNSNVVPVLMLGASLGLKSSCKLTGESGSASAEIDCDDPVFEGVLDLKSVDIGISGGAGVDIPLGERAVLAPSARYTRGISDIGDTSDNADTKNSAFQIGVAVRFKL